jgi:hypothetical protein
MSWCDVTGLGRHRGRPSNFLFSTVLEHARTQDHGFRWTPTSGASGFARNLQPPGYRLPHRLHIGQKTDFGQRRRSPNPSRSVDSSRLVARRPLCPHAGPHPALPFPDDEHFGASREMGLIWKSHAARNGPIGRTLRFGKGTFGTPSCDKEKATRKSGNMFSRTRCAQASCRSHALGPIKAKSIL